MQKKVFRYEKEKRCTCTLYMTESCNLNCVYCYEHIKGKAIIPLEIAQEAIKSTFKRAVKEQINYVEILFHGGDLIWKKIKINVINTILLYFFCISSLFATDTIAR